MKKSIVGFEILPTIVTVVSLIISLSGSIHSQSRSEKVLFSEDFREMKSLSKKWIAKDAITRLSDKGLAITVTKNAPAYLFREVPDFDASSDFSITCSIRTSTIGQRSRFALLWGAKDEKNSSALLWQTDSTLQTFRYDSGRIAATSIVKSVPSSAFDSAVIELTILKVGDAFGIYLNGSWMLYTSRINQKMFGNKIGIGVSPGSSIEVEAIEVRQLSPVGIKTIKEAVFPFKKEMLSESVNSQFDELSPFLTPDGKTLFFVRTEDPRNQQPSGAGDIWVSTINDSGVWTTAAPLPRPFNNEGSNCVISLTPDGNTMFLSNRYSSSGGYEGTGVSQSRNQGTQWTIPTPLVIDSFYNLNRFAEYSFGTDGQTLILAIERNDTRGDKDLYVSFANPNGSFSSPLSLGNTINSIGNEASPFLAADGQTLYFATDGKRGYGAHDIYVSKRLDSTWTKWSPPLNLGSSVNTASFDAYYTLSAKGDFAFMTTYDNTQGGADICRIPIPQSAKPKPVILVGGRVLDSKTRSPLGSMVTVMDNKSNKPVSSSKTNPVDGRYSFSLLAGDRFTFTISAKGYLPLSETVNLSEYSSYQEVRRDFLMEPVKIQQSVRLNNVQFDFGSAHLKVESNKELDGLVEFLTTNPTTEIEIRGYTDNVGEHSNNQVLSDERAKSVLTYLTSKGISPSRLKSIGLGESKPLISNDTEKNRSINRRVEFHITKK